MSIRIWGAAAAFGLALLAAAAALLAQTRAQTLARADEQLLRTLATAETEANRALMQIDLTLAALPSLLKAAQRPDGWDAEAANLALAELQERQLLFADIALLDESSGQPWATALRATRRTGLDMPPGFIERIRALPVPALTLSDAVVVRSSGERGLLVGRPLDLPGMAPLVAVVEVPAVLLLPATAAIVSSVQGLSVRLERADGQPLLIQPPDEAALEGKLRLPAPSASRAAASEVAVQKASDGDALRIASRATLYPDVRLVARRLQSDALAAWYETLRWVLAVEVLFLLLVGVVARTAQVQWVRLTQARQAADASAELLDRGLEAMGDAFLLCDANDRVVRWNARYVQLFPWQAEVVSPGVPFRRLLEAGAARRFGALHAEALAWVEERLRARDSMTTERTQQQDVHSGFVVSLIERRMPDGGIVSVYRDMTANERELIRARQEAESANAAKSQFLANMSHEIRTPLNAVLGLNQMLLLGRLDREQRRLASLVQSSGRLLLSLINDILDLSRIEAGHFETHEETFEPLAVVDEVCAMLRERAVEQRLGLELDDRTPPGTRLRGDAMRLRQVLLNLIGNAIKFTEQGRVTVRLRLIDDDAGTTSVRLVLEVIDTGIGIPPDQLPRLFERFSQLDSSATRRHSGSGLGLAITREVVERLGGRIGVLSQAGQGSTFEVELPFHRVESNEPDEPAASRLEAPIPVVQPLRVLVAEDNPVNQVLIQALLSHLGHEATLVGNGLEAVQALQTAEEGRFDIVLMDMQMPEVDGLEATRRIRALAGPRACIPVLAMTANAREEDRLACQAAGMDGFVSKPIEFGLLDRTLRQTATRGSGSGVQAE
ncbi:MAG: ATP-binding protein [Rubrivivax sp.]